METLKEYLLIKFVPETAQEKRKPFVDCTRSEWVLLCPTRRRLVTKFMGPPYDEENNNLLESLLKLKASAPEDWPTYPIEVKGQADTYEEAMQKLARLEVTEFVFTTDSEVDPHKKADIIQNKLKIKKLTITENTKKEINSVPAMESDSDNYSPQYDITDSDSSCASKKKKKIESTKKKNKDKNRKLPKFATKRLPALKINKKDEKTPSISQTLSNVTTSSTQSVQKIENHTDLSLKNSEVNSNENSTKIREEKDFINTDELGKNLAVPRKKKTLKKDDLPLVLLALKGLSVDVQEILANQRSILLHLGQRETAKEKLFAEKHKLAIPFQSTEQFDEFNEQLKIDDKFRTEFSSSLNYLFDRELNVSKTLTNIFKKYLSRNVILKFMAKKKVLGKRIMKGTYFYECISGVIIQTHGRPGEKSLTEDNICSLISKVFNNAKDWEGERQKRAALQNRLSDEVVRGKSREYQNPEKHPGLDEHQDPEELDQDKSEELNNEDESESST